MKHNVALLAFAKLLHRNAHAVCLGANTQVRRQRVSVKDGVMKRLYFHAVTAMLGNGSNDKLIVTDL